MIVRLATSASRIGARRRRKRGEEIVLINKAIGDRFKVYIVEKLSRFRRLDRIRPAKNCSLTKCNLRANRVARSIKDVTARLANVYGLSYIEFICHGCISRRTQVASQFRDK